MGILSSLFQAGAPTQQVAGPMVATSKLPEELAPYYKDILGKAQALYDERTKEGYQPYQGPTIADFTPEQQQAFTGLQGLVGSQAPVFQEGMDLTRSAAKPMTSEQMTQYMSPYQQAVTDIEKREATKQYESQVVPALAAKAATTGGFGGSRQAILEGMAADTQQRLLSDIQAKGSQQAYQDAVRRFQADRTAAGQAGAQLATMAPQQFKAQLGELGAIQTIGEEKQRQQQTALDEAFRQYTLERNYPYDTMSKYQAVVTGAPVQTTEFAQPAAPTPSIGQQLIAGIGTLGAAYGQFSGTDPFKLMSKKGGGGLSDLPIVYRENGRQVLNRDSITNMLNVDLSGVNEFIIPSDAVYTKRHNLPPNQQFKRQSGESLHPFFRQAMQAGIPAGSAFEVSIGEGNKPVFSVVDTNQSNEQKETLEERVEDKIQSINQPYDLKQSFSHLPGRTTLDDETLNIAEENLGEVKTRMTELNKQIDEIIKNNPLKSEAEITKMIEGRFDISRGELESHINKRKNELDKQLVEDTKDTDEFYKGQEDTITEFLKKKKEKIDTQESDATQRISDFYDGKTTRLENRKDLLESNLKTRQLNAAAERAAFYGDRETALKAREAANKEEYNRQQYGNLAMFFARLGTASPKQGGIAGVLGAGLEAAEQTLPEASATRAAYKKSKDGIADRREILAINKRGEKLQSTADANKTRDAIDSFIYKEEGEIASGQHIDTETLINRIEQKKDDLINKDFELTNNNNLSKRLEKKMSIKENRDSKDNLMDKYFDSTQQLNNQEFAMLLQTVNTDYDNAVKELQMVTQKSNNLNSINDATLRVLEVKSELAILNQSMNADFSAFQMSPKDSQEYVFNVLDTRIPGIKKALGAGKMSLYINEAIGDVNKSLVEAQGTTDLRSLTKGDYGNMLVERVMELYNLNENRDLESEIKNEGSINKLNSEGGPNTASDVLQGLRIDE